MKKIGLLLLVGVFALSACTMMNKKDKKNKRHSKKRRSYQSQLVVE